MARKTASGVNKSQAVRDYLAQNPSATPNQIVAALKEQGIEISVGLASNVKYTSGKRRGKVRRRKVSLGGLLGGGGATDTGSMGGMNGPRRGRPSLALSTDDLLATKQLINKVGSAEKIRKALDLLEQLR
jgi:hypothetical protein